MRVARDFAKPSRTVCCLGEGLVVLERLMMATPAHLKRARCIWFPNETVRVSFRLITLRRVAAVTAIAGNAVATVRARLKYRYDLIAF